MTCENCRFWDPNNPKLDEVNQMNKTLKEATVGFCQAPKYKIPQKQYSFKLGQVVPAPGVIFNQSFGCINFKK